MTTKNEWKLYELLNNYPNNPLCELACFMGWSEKKTLKYLNKLIERKLVIGEKCGYKNLMRYNTIPWKNLLGRKVVENLELNKYQPETRKDTSVKLTDGN